MQHFGKLNIPLSRAVSKITMAPKIKNTVCIYKAFILHRKINNIKHRVFTMYLIVEYNTLFGYPVYTLVVLKYASPCEYLESCSMLKRIKSTTRSRKIQLQVILFHVP